MSNLAEHEIYSLLQDEDFVNEVIGKALESPDVMEELAVDIAEDLSEVLGKAVTCGTSIKETRTEKTMADRDHMDCVFRMSKEQGVSLGIQLASGSLYSGVIEEMDGEFLLVRGNGKKKRRTLLARSGVVALFAANADVALWNGLTSEPGRS